MSISSLYASWTDVHTFRAKDTSLDAAESILLVSNVNRLDEQPEFRVALVEGEDVELWHSTRFDAVVDFVKATDGATLVSFMSSYMDARVHILCVQFEEREQRNLKAVMFQID